MIKKTIIFSIIIQIIIIIFSVIPITFKIQEKNRILQKVLIIENIVQFIELSFYILILYIFYNKFDKIDIAKYRYYDWVLTTPTMILNTVIFFEYNKYLKLNKVLTLTGFFNNHYGKIIKLFILNLFMLLFGFLQEIKKISIYYSTSFGFIFFGFLFYYIYKYFVLDISDNYFIFYAMLIIWGLYGIAAIFKNKIKNTSYNILDIFSKNFYALYIAFIVYNL